MKYTSLFVLIFVIIYWNVFASKLPSNNLKPCVNRKIIAQNIKTKEIRQFNNTCELWYEWVELGKNSIHVFQKKHGIIWYIGIPEWDSNNRYIILLSRWNQYDFNNSTYKLSNVKELFINWYKILIIKSKNPGKIYITSTISSKIYLAIKDNNKLFIKSLNWLWKSKFIKVWWKIYKFIRLN